MGFNLVNLVITVRSEHATDLRKRLPLLGNEYASACRSHECRWPKRTCETCSVQDECGWFLVFGQKLTSDPVALKRHQKPPLPFVFRFPLLAELSEAAREIECGLVVCGRAISQLEMLLNGFAELLSSGTLTHTAEITRIACRDYQGLIVNHGPPPSDSLVPHDLIISSTEGLLESSTWSTTNLQIRLVSPLRLIGDGRMLSRFEFKRFARSVMRRVSALAYYYGENEFECDFKEMSRQAEEVVCTDDHFNYTNLTNMKICGITGYGGFSGEFTALVPFLVLGSYVHAGKGASFGMGAYELYEM